MWPVGLTKENGHIITGLWVMKIKHYCVACGAKIKNPRKNYQERGNYCVKCSTRIEQSMKLKHYSNLINVDDILFSNEPDLSREIN